MTTPAKSRDCPVCPSCKVPAGSTMLPEPVGHIVPGFDPSGRELACLACGHRWQGTVEEYLQAHTADVAWLRREQSEAGKSSADARRAEERAKYERAMRGQW